MPKCEFCGEVPFLTYCASFEKHRDYCGKTAKRFMDKKALDLKASQVFFDPKDFVSRYDDPKGLRLSGDDDPKDFVSRYDDPKGLRLFRDDEENSSHRSPVVHSIVNNTYINIDNSHNVNNTNNTLYIDYPSTPLTNHILQTLQGADVRSIKTLEDFNKIINYALDADNHFLDRCIQGHDKRAKSQALSFMADLARKTRELMVEKHDNQGRLEIQEIVEDVKEYEKDLLTDKKLLGC
jgi:hypothetical protein